MTLSLHDRIPHPGAMRNFETTCTLIHIIYYTGSSKDGVNQSRPPADVFLIEHLEWLLKIGCSVDKILEWAREKEQNQAPSHFNSDTGIGVLDIPNSSIPHHGECMNSVHETLNQQQASGQYNVQYA